MKPKGKEEIMIIKVNGIEIGAVSTNRSLTISEAMYSIGYDITNEEDCKKGYENNVEGFYIDGCGNYAFDEDAAEMEY